MKSLDEQWAEGESPEEDWLVAVQVAAASLQSQHHSNVFWG